MIDLHVHMLPGLDDGAAEDTEALAMARAAVADGIRTAVVTPHWTPGLYPNDRETILAATQRFRDLLARQGVSLSIVPGAELHVHPCLTRRLKDRWLLTLNDTLRYALVELPLTTLPVNVDLILYDLTASGITPILAHPERCAALARHPERLARWVRSGVLVQITAGSLLGEFGPHVRRLAVRFLKRGLVHVMASDGHGPDRRPPRLSRAVQEAALIVGVDAARALVDEIPRRILAGETWEPKAVHVSKQRKPWWRKLWR
jgi:protein-tyrosine phosphatase